MATWLDNPAARRRVQLHLDWFDRRHDGILGGGLDRPASVPKLKDAVKRAKWALGYPVGFQTWAKGVDQQFIDRLHHPGPGSYGLPPEWAALGLSRRRDFKERARPQRISPRGVRFIADFEGFRANAYRDPVGVLTIGYGHTGPDTARLGPLTREKAAALLDRDLDRFEAAVRRLVRVPLTQGQFDALTSFAYNCGEGALAGSTLLAKLNRRDYEGAAREFGRWTRGGGREWPGLVRRRAAEARMFRS